ncbi:MAG: YitT family protein, partial [Acidaminococcaceae bacterium]|nr:YitT family protein [Acidaminococcaceae bacterium]
MTITKAIQIRSILTRLIGLLFGSMVYSAGLNLFLVPNSIIDGGVVGISLILAEL